MSIDLGPGAAQVFAAVVAAVQALLLARIARGDRRRPLRALRLTRDGRRTK